MVKLQKIKNFIKVHKFFFAGLLLAIVWCYPYFFSFGRMALGDFSFFSQGYEAIRQSIVVYGQFPWWNPWVSGGIPLYANPQFGVFSITTLFTLVVGAIPALKLTVILFTVLGYVSMYIFLKKYLKIDQLTSAILALLWILCSFFVFHLPSHITFVWYLVAPAYIYISLKLNTIKNGIILGLMFSVMALNQIHNPFIHISIICGSILLVRTIKILFTKSVYKKIFLKSLFVAAIIFICLCTHRVLFTYQNMHDFPRDVVDITPAKEAVILGMTLPYSKAHTIDFINYPAHPAAPHGFGEATVTAGIFTLIAFGIAIFYLAFIIYRDSAKPHRLVLRKYKVPLFLLAIYLLFVLIGLGAQTSFSPYSIIKHLPIISEMRLSSRWLIFAIIAMLAFIGYLVKLSPKRSFVRFIIVSLLLIGIIENFALNFSYQDKVFDWQPNTANTNTDKLSFGQTSYFGKVLSLPDSNKIIPRDAGMPGEYREYEATTYNLGVLYANDSFVQIQLANKKSPLCSIDQDCRLIQTNNAKLIKWSPNEFILERKESGPITMNISPSNYMSVNKKRVDAKQAERVAEPFKQLTIYDNSKTIIVKYSPELKTAVKSSLSTTPKYFHDYQE